MDNLFNFSYEMETLKNRDGSDSRYEVVYGQGGNIVHTKFDSYRIIKTEDLSLLGSAFIESGLVVSPYHHKDGKVIGLKVDLGGTLSKVGDLKHSAIINVPNNGAGMGYLALYEKRLWCANGSTHTKMGHKDMNIKIPHTFGYKEALRMVERSLVEFGKFIQVKEERLREMDGRKMNKQDLLFTLNEWFYYHEMPTNHKEGMSFNKFRELLVLDPASIKSIQRYEELMKAMNRELGYNEELGLDMSYYTAFATVTNYLSRRQEKSGSKAPDEIQFIRASKKTEYFGMFA